MIEAYGDLGTNTFHQLILDRHIDGSFIVLDYKIEFVKLMVESTLLLSPEAESRAYTCLNSYKTIQNAFHVQNVKWCATEGLRKLDSSNKFQSRVFQELGIEIQVISGQEEAKYISKSLAQCVPDSTAFLGFDIGGGSTELMARLANGNWIMQSYQMGAAFMYKTFQTSDPLNADEKLNMQTYIQNCIDDFKSKLPPSTVFEFVVGASGSLDSVLEIVHFPTKESEIFGTKGYADIQISQFQQQTIQLEGISNSERVLVPGLMRERVEMMPAALCIAEKILQFADLPVLRVSQASLLMALVNSGIESITD